MGTARRLVIAGTGFALGSAVCAAAPTMVVVAGRALQGIGGGMIVGVVHAMVERHLALARRLTALVDAAPDLERLAPAALSIVTFRYAPPALRGDDARLDALNKRLMEQVQTNGEVFVTNTSAAGRFALRACVLHYATTDADVAALVDAVRRTGAALV